MASVAYGVVAVPAGSDVAPAAQEMRKILLNYADKGLPTDLVDAAKRSEIAAAEFQRNSIPGLSNVWSEALAAEGRNSPDEDIDAIKKVTLDDVNRVAKQYLSEANSITAVLKPVPSDQPSAERGFGGGEKVTSAPTKPVELPTWASASLTQLKVPTNSVQALDATLANGIRLIVKTDTTSPTISVYGSIRHNGDLHEHRRALKASPTCSTASFPTALRRSTASPSRKPWTTSPPMRTPATTSLAQAR